MSSSRWALSLVAALAVGLGSWAQEGRLKYPETKKGDVVDDYHGTKVADPYRWLEDDVRKSKDVADWVEAQNKVTYAFLEVDPRARGDQEAASPSCGTTRRSPPRPRTAAATSSARTTACRTRTSSTCRTRSTASADAASTPTRGPRTAPSPSPAWRSATTASYLAYGVAEAGSRLEHLERARRRHRQAARRRTEVGQVQRRVVDQGRQGLLLQPLPRAEEGRRRSRASTSTRSSTTTSSARRRARTCWSTSGPTSRSGASTASVTEDGRYLVITVGDGTTSRKVRIVYKDLSKRRRQADRPRSTTSTTSSTSSATTARVFYFQTDYNAPKDQVIAIDTAKPDQKNWKTIIPEAKETLDGVEPGRQPASSAAT